MTPGRDATAASKPSRAQVDIWRVDLDVVPSVLEACLESLDAGELHQFQRLRHDAERFAAAHGILRAILGAQTGLDPSRLEFEFGPHRKPSLAPGQAADLRFSLSRSEGRALIAIAHERDVGVDLERVRPDLDFAPVAADFFTEAERRILAELPRERRCEAFFEIWTRKEALWKAQGSGLSGAPVAIEFLSREAESARLDLEEDRRWSIRKIDAGPGFAAAVAVEGEDDFVIREQGLPPEFDAWHAPQPRVSRFQR